MFEVNEIVEKDLEACAKLFVSTFNGPPWNDQWNEDSAYHRLKDIWNTPGFYGLVGKIEGAIGLAVFGCLEHWYDGYAFQLKEMFVQEELRGNGAGSQLLSILENNLKEKMVKSIYLITAEGDLTEKFYSKNGHHRVEGMILMSKRVEE